MYVTALPVTWIGNGQIIFVIFEFRLLSASSGTWTDTESSGLSENRLENTTLTVSAWSNLTHSDLCMRRYKRDQFLDLNYRTAQTMQWSPAILDYMKN